MDYNFKELCKNVVNKLPEIFEAEGISYTSQSNRLSFSCFVHDSDKTESACVYTQESQMGIIGNWQCFTNNCHEKVGRSVLNLVHEIYSKKGWTKQKTYNHLKEITGHKDRVLTDKTKFIHDTNLLMQPVFPERKDHFSLSALSNLSLPSDYYQKRGFTPTILNKHGVGDCKKLTKFRNRVVIPIFNEEKTEIINFLGRSIFDQCIICNKFHKLGTFCPTTQLENYNAVKWINYSNINETLYNLWHAMPYIEKSETCILVEGSSDCWKLEEAGIFNCLGLLTNNISYLQKIKLETLPCTKVILCLDNDEKGKEGKELIEKKIGRYFKIDEVVTGEKDVSEMNIEDIKKLFGV